MQETQSPQRPQAWTSVVEQLIITAIVSSLWAILWPAVISARESQGLPTWFPWLPDLVRHAPVAYLLGVPILATVSVALLAMVIRSLLPERARARIPWVREVPKPAEPPPPPPPIADSRPALLVLTISLIAGAAIILGAAHIHFTYGYRSNQVTWEGPLGDLAGPVLFLAGVVSLLNLAFGMYVLRRFCSKSNDLAMAGIVLAVINLIGWSQVGIFLVAILED